MPDSTYVRKKPPTLQYVCLAFLFVAACGYQVRATVWTFPSFFGLSQPSWPFYPSYTHGELRGVLLNDKAKAAGMRENDVVIAIHGRSFRGTAVFGEAMSRAKPGDALEVTVRTSPSSTERALTIPLERRTSRPSWALASIVLLKIVLPFFSIFLGCWVVLARPRDSAAWLLVGVLLGMSNIFSAGVESWGPGIRDFASFYLTACSHVWPICMFYFGLVFPEPFPPGKIEG